jgi:hypothetical protein
MPLARPFPPGAEAASHPRIPILQSRAGSLGEQNEAQADTR